MSIDTYDLNCPYCNEGLDVCHDDGFGYEEGIKHQMQCSGCGKYFVFNTSITIDYEPEKADCLNGSDHDWQFRKVYPHKYSKVVCGSCGEERKPTEEEMSENINQTTQP